MIKVKDCVTLRKHIIKSMKKICKKDKCEIDKIEKYVDNIIEKNKDIYLSKFVKEFLKIKNGRRMFNLFYDNLADDIGLYNFVSEGFILFL